MGVSFQTCHHLFFSKVKPVNYTGKKNCGIMIVSIRRGTILAHIQAGIASL